MPILKPNLEFISKIICDAYNVPIFILNNKTNHIIRNGDHLKHPLFHSIEEFINRLIQPEDQQNLPLIRTTNYLETLVVFHSSSIETIIIGPFSSYEVTEEIVNGIMHDYQISSDLSARVASLLQSIRMVKPKTNFVSLLPQHYLICQEPLEEELVRSQLMYSEEIEPTDIEQLVRHRRLEASFHMDYRVEQKIWQYVKEGDKEKLLQHFDTTKIGGVFLIRKKVTFVTLKIKQLSLLHLQQEQQLTVGFILKLLIR